MSWLRTSDLQSLQLDLALRHHQCSWMGAFAPICSLYPKADSMAAPNTLAHLSTGISGVRSRSSLGH